MLDGYVLSAPSMQGVILDGKPSITGDFTQDSAKVLADQLKYGALPLSFEVVSSDTISATLGSQQLKIGLIAGLIGLLLVAVYSLIVYRALGFVIVASLLVMGVLTYVTICILAWRMGFRLSLAGVAGLIVSIGFTADSFIVYFERIRDELRDGKSITGAVEDGWGRAKRTIYISKSINILAAVVLYILADATVKGFAFTLGLTTVIDVVIFILFTHPVMQLLARTKFFGSGHPLSGMDPEALGAVYRGRAQFRAPAAAVATTAAGTTRVEEPRRGRAPSDHRRAQAGRIRRRRGREDHHCCERQTGHDGQGGRRLMRSMSQLGNDLYTGKTSFPFVGRRNLWFIIAAILVIGSALVPLFRPIQFSIEFTGGSQFTVSGVSSPDQDVATDAVHTVVPDATTKVTTIGDATIRVQTDQMTANETRQVSVALAEAYEVPQSEVTSSFIGPSWGADVTRTSLWGLVIFLILTFVILALYFRTWKMSAAAIIGLVDVLVITVGSTRCSGSRSRPRRSSDSSRSCRTRSMTRPSCSTRSGRTRARTAKSRGARSASP